MGRILQGVEKATVAESDRTRGDLSPEAASGLGVTEVRVDSIPIASPGGSKTDVADTALTADGRTYLEPPDDPEELYRVYRLSPHLQPIIEAMVVGAYKTGPSFPTRVNFDRPEGREEVVKHLMWKSGNLVAEEPSDEAVDAEIARLKRLAKMEEVFLRGFFEAAVLDMTFDQLLEHTGLDLEVTGMAYWEVMRDDKGFPSRIQWLPAVDMRPLKQPHERIACEKLVRDGIFEWRRVKQIRQFRGYVQLGPGDFGAARRIRAYFKEYGDPRVLSRSSGEFYEDYESFLSAEWTDRTKPAPLPATEIIQFTIPYPGAPGLGKPRWSGIYPDMVGSRELSEENLKQASDSVIPNLMLLVSNGIIAKDDVDRLREQIENRKKGRKEILVVTAQTPNKAPVSPSPIPTMEIVKLRSEQTNDALFQKYDERNEAKAQAAFRLPRALVGKDLGQNRATTQAMLRYAERYVFAPARKTIDNLVNALILPELGIQTRVYQTKAIDLADPETVSEITERLVKTSLLTPNEGRSIVGPVVYNRDLPPLDQAWADLPPPILIALLQSKNRELSGALLSDEGTLDELSLRLRETVLNPDAAPAIDGDQGPTGMEG